MEGRIRLADGSSVADLQHGVMIRVILADTTSVGALYTVINEQSCTIGAGSWSGVFALSFDKEDIDPRNEYALISRISNEEGRLIYINDTVHPVITRPFTSMRRSEDRDIEVVVAP